jgi:hypothetical protein
MTAHSSKSVLVNHPEEHVEVGYVAHPPFAFKSRFYRTPYPTTGSCLHLIFLHIKDGCKHAPPTRPFPKSGFWVPAVVMRKCLVGLLPSLIFSPKCLTFLDTFRYRIVYQVRPDAIAVLTVFDGRR